MGGKNKAGNSQTKKKAKADENPLTKMFNALDTMITDEQRAKVYKAVQQAGEAWQGAVGDVELRAYPKVWDDFKAYHSDPVNVFLHMATTPLMLIGLFSFLNCLLTPLVTTLIVFGHLGSLFSPQFELPQVTFFCSAVMGIACHTMASLIGFGWVASLGAIVTGYLGQELSHCITGEQTYESTYSGDSYPNPLHFFKGGKGMQRGLEHIFYLMPLVSDAFFTSFDMSWLMPQNRSVSTNLLTTKQNDEDLAMVEAWVKKQPSLDPKCTSHFYVANLPEDIKDRVVRLAESDNMSKMFHAVFPEDRYAISSVEGMNEVYVASKNGYGSDKVFYTKHVDGPFPCFPFGSLYRCIVAVNPNEEIITKLPEEEVEMTVTRGEVLGFDYNREVHLIDKHPSKLNKDYRICLKLHYVVYPQHFHWYGALLGRLNIIYNTLARKLFIATLLPNDTKSQFMSDVILKSTQCMHLIQEYVGWTNLGYLMFMTVLGAYTDYRIRILGTSFVHYGIYMSTYYYRENVNYHRFKRNCAVFKAAAMLQLGWYYLGAGLTEGFLIAGFLMACAGAVTCICATKALGVDRTYFGVELGRLEPKTVTEFPYDVIPHPMITSQVLAFAGMWLQYGFRNELPWLCPLHIAFYLAHCYQEEYDIKATKSSKRIVVDEMPVIRQVAGTPKPAEEATEEAPVPLKAAGGSPFDVEKSQRSQNAAQTQEQPEKSTLSTEAFRRAFLATR